MKNEEVWKLYLPEIDECDIISEYIESVTTVGIILLDDARTRRRFALAGLFPTYRACNHMGITMSSSVSYQLSSPHRERLNSIEDIIGKPISNTNEYLKMIGLSPFGLLNPFVKVSRKLKTFVLR